MAKNFGTQLLEPPHSLNPGYAPDYILSCVLEYYLSLYLIHVATGQWVLILILSLLLLSITVRTTVSTQQRRESVAHRVSQVDQQDRKMLCQASGHPVNQPDVRLINRRRLVNRPG